MKNKIIIGLLLATAIGWSQQTPAQKQSKSILIKGATAHIGNGNLVNNAYISIKNGKIAALSATVISTPHDTIIDATGQHVYPGFIAPNASLGLVEIDAVRASDDESEMGEMNPHIRSLIAYNAESKLTETARINGVLLAQIAPRGGRISGTSSVVQLDAWNWEDAVVKENDGIHLHWPNSLARNGWWAEPGETESNKNYDKQIKELQDFFDKSKEYSLASAQKDIALEAMKDLLSGNKTLFVEADHEKEIMDIIYFAQKNNLKKVVLISGYYAYKVADELVKNNFPVLLRRIHDLPLKPDEDVNLPYKVAALLVKKGVLVGLQNAGDMERMQVRNLPFNAGTTAAFGLDKEQALQLITSNTAKILGIDAQYGTLEANKSATLFISKGDALNMPTNQLTFALIDGRKILLDSHQTTLYKRYNNKLNGKK